MSADDKCVDKGKNKYCQLSLQICCILVSQIYAGQIRFNYQTKNENIKLKVLQKKI